MELNVNRRGFLKGAATAGIAAAAVAGVGATQAHADEAAEESFDDSYDIVIIGDGFAGISAALHAVDEGANVLIVEVAPEGEDGGNSRYCAQWPSCGSDTEALFEYYKALGWKFEQDDDVLEAFVNGLTEMRSIFIRLGVEDPILWSEFVDSDTDSPYLQTVKNIRAIYGPEYPELPGGSAIDTMSAPFEDQAFYFTAHDTVMDTDGVTVWLESPAKHLIVNDSGAVVGVIVEHDGAEMRIGAKSVVLACGGFEANTEMLQDYLGCARLAPEGSLYNKGDGIKMAMEIGADLWHMQNYEGLCAICGCYYYDVPEGGRAINTASPTLSGAAIVVADDGSRFVDEYSTSSSFSHNNRHGHVYTHGVYRQPNICYRPYMVMDEAEFTIKQEGGQLSESALEAMVSADTAEELAEIIDVDPEILSRTIQRFNSYAEQGEDIEFDRDPETMRAFEGKLYATPLTPVVLNTQGGPRRDAQAHVIDTNGNPIPGLYSAGECGGICTFYYQGGSNIAEALIFGKIAGINAAQGI